MEGIEGKIVSKDRLDLGDTGRVDFRDCLDERIAAEFVNWAIVFGVGYGNVFAVIDCGNDGSFCGFEFAMRIRNRTIVESPAIL